MWPSHYSVFTDVVGERGKFNPAYHLSMESDVKGLVNFINGDGAQITELSQPGTEMPVSLDADYLHQYGLIPDVSSALLSQWSSEAFNAFHDQIPTSVSVANFLYELRDIKGLVPKIQRSVSKTASSNFLAFEFGIKPFVSDVKRILTLSDAVSKRLKHLRDTMGKPVDLRFERELDFNPVPAPIIIEPPASARYFDLPYGWEFRRAGYRGRFNASAKLLQNLEGLDLPMSNLKAFAAASGFNNPAAIVWEAIPYSFVVDWLFHLDQQIGKLAIQPFGGEWTLSNVGYSITEEWHYLVYQRFFPAYNPLQFVGSAKIRRYQRFPGLPVSSLFLTDGSLTPKQLVLSLALLNQRS